MEMMGKSQMEGRDQDWKVVTWKAEHVKNLRHFGKLEEV
jgi:hypothetical protein